MKLRVSEIFGGVDENAVSPVLQGEGYRLGKPSIFVRTFGCNFRCKNFGIKNLIAQKKNIEVQEIIENLVHYKSLEELPLVKTGCDSYFSVYPEFKKFTKDYDPEELVKIILDRQPPQKLSRCDIVFTGGEPLLHQSFFKCIIPSLDKHEQNNITFETNGTIVLEDDLIEIMNRTNVQYLWSVSPKLKHSGHALHETFILEALNSYNKVKNSTLVLKFVISEDNFDESELFTFIKGYAFNNIKVEDIFLMPEGGINDLRYEMNRKFVIDLCCRYGFRYSPRLQLELYGNKVGT